MMSEGTRASSSQNPAQAGQTGRKATEVPNRLWFCIPCSRSNSAAQGSVARWKRI